MLTTVYQASANSGTTTRDAAKAVAEAIGAKHYDWEIGEIVRLYERTVEQATGIKLDWATHDIPLQNIQARVRSPGVWLLANLKNAFSSPPAIGPKPRLATPRWMAAPAAD